MKVFKAADWMISAVLILGGAILVIFDPSYWWQAYLLTGGWQVCSLLVHRLGGWFQAPRGDRVCYTWIVGIIGGLVLLAEWEVFFGLVYCFLFPAAPVMALWYARLCYLEWRSCTQRPSSLFR